MKRLVFFFSMFVIAALACNFSASQTPTAIPPGTIAPSTTPALFDTPPIGEPSPTSAPVSAPLEITGKYLMAFHACDAAAAECRDPRNHQVYLAQSDDGAQWSLVPGWTSYPGSVPDVIRRGDTIYIYTPGTLVRYHLDTGVLESPISVTIEGVDMFVDPSAFVDEQGRLTLFFLYGQKGGDPAGCLPSETTCEKRFGSATEVEGSDGAQFTVDEDDRAVVTLSGNLRSASDPDLFFDGSQYILYISHGPSISVWTSPELRGTYTQVSVPPDGLFSAGTGGVACGYFDEASGQYWTFAHAPRQGGAATIQRAVHSDFSQRLDSDDWTVILSGESLGLPATANVESPGFAVNTP